jgi:cell division control protein 6
MPSYVPSVLPHREEELRLLSSFYIDALNNIKQAYLRTVQIIGGPGSGKTCSVKRFGERLEKEASKRKVDLKHVYMNCELGASTRFVFYVNLLEKVSPDIATRSMSPEEMIRVLIDYLRNEGKYLLISVDDIDYFCKRSKEHLVYDLTRLNELYPGEPCPVIGVVFTAKDTSFHAHLEPSEVSTLGKCIIRFQNYTSEQIRDILEQRVDLSFQSGAVGDEILEFISDVTAEDFKGDVRVALDFLLYAGNLAENQGCEYVSPEHVRQVYAKTYPWLTTSDIASLNQTCKLILLAMAGRLNQSGQAYMPLSEIREAYEFTCEEYGFQPVKEEEFEECVQDLCNRGIIRMRSLLKLGISDVPAEELARFLDSLITRLKSEI